MFRFSLLVVFHSFKIFLIFYTNDRSHGMTTSNELTEPLLSSDTMVASSTIANYNHDEGGLYRYTPVAATETATTTRTITPLVSTSRSTVKNFIAMAVLFSANHGCTVACLSLATARLGSIGAWQSGILYISYTASAILGATYVTKVLGGRNAIMTGMTLCKYVCVWSVRDGYFPWQWRFTV